MSLFLQQAFNGLALGATYALFAMGFSLVFATLNILSIAHGTFATWAAIIALWGVKTMGWPILIAMAFALVVTGLGGVVMDQLGFQPLRQRGSGGFFGVLLSSVGFWIILLNIALIVTNARFSAFPLGSYPRHFYNVGPLVLSSMQILAIVISTGTAIVLYWYVHRTRAGAAMRAVGYDPQSAALAGINSRKIIIWTSFLAAFVAGLAGAVSAVMTNNVSFVLGEGMLLKGFAAVVIGGFGDMRGAFIGGLVIGLSEVLGGQYVSSAFRDVFAFGLLFTFLLVRPRGILGTEELALKL